MTFLFGGRRHAANRRIIDRLNGDLVTAVRSPAFYESGVPDTFAGRFDVLVLHLVLVVRRLRGCGEPGPAMAQDLIDTVFKHLDPAMRELGVGDMAVPKRMKRLAEGFLGRSLAYDAALAMPGDDVLAESLSRNLYGGTRPALDLAAYVRSAAALLETCSVEVFTEGPVRFPDPAAFLVQEAA